MRVCAGGGGEGGSSCFMVAGVLSKALARESIDREVIQYLELHYLAVMLLWDPAKTKVRMGQNMSLRSKCCTFNKRHVFHCIKEVRK